MDWLQFSASIVGSIAWPLAAIIIVALFRKVLVALLSKLTKLKYGDIEATFGEALEQAEREGAALPEPAQGEQLPPALDDLAKYSNNSAIFIAWLEVEAALLDRARSAGLLKTNMSALQAARELFGRQMLNKQTYQITRDLFNLRNIAVHPASGRFVSDQEVSRFKKLADKVTSLLREG